MPTSAIRSREPILGYEVTERIGAGGYGEVWQATAPGGLTKAIKFVYGYLDDERARRELKALSRVKLVRHPFLLSLERIEVVDGQLVIVTELADMSLKDRHEECKAAGMVGIPRDELLVYLHDAADALDYMREKYSLQHLDVKPENLLLVAGHVKVADFGLVKDIADTRASMMGGLTPIYASPEVFDDRPSQCSDQYSLAIVYQEMLTDTLPFPGKTTAQLAAQHLQSRPRLTALPLHDKAIIERALCKDPQARYATAREMVDALIAAGRSSTSGKPNTAGGTDTTPLATNETHQARPTSLPANAPETSTQMLDGVCPAIQVQAPGEANGNATCVGLVEKRAGGKIAPAEPGASDDPSTNALPASPLAELATPAAAAPMAAVPRRARTEPVIRDFPPLDVSAAASVRPALFVGLGGTGRMVVAQLRRRMADRFGDLKCLPAFRLLVADTDAEEVEGERSSTSNGDAGVEDFLSMPLRRPEDYRRGSTRLLSWMSRRWLYNIPRSLETEGLRPLGRLALVDHAEQLVEQLKAALDAITDPAALERTAASAKLPAGEATPRVTLVASIAGGTGGGMVLDVAYLLRKLLRERGLPDDCLDVLLLHWSSRNTAAHELAVANSFGTLSELTHFCQHGYPGEAAFGLSPTGAAEARLANMYLIHLGGELGEHDVPTAARNVADYLFLGTATAAAHWLDVARRESRDADAKGSAADDIALRTFGICRLGADEEMAAGAADELCGTLLESWCGAAADRQARSPSAADRGRRPAPESLASTIERLAGERVALLNLSLDTLVDTLERAAESCLGCDVDSFLSHEVVRIMALPPSKSVAAGELNDEPHPHVGALDRALGMPATGAEPTKLVMALEAHIRDTARQQAEALRAWAVALADNPRVRFAGAVQGIEEVARHVRPLRDVAQKTRAKTTEEMRTAAVAVIGGKARPRLWPARGAAQVSAEDQQARLLQYASLKFMETLFMVAAKYAQQLTWELTSIADSLSEARREVARLALLFQHDGTPRRPAREGAAAAVDAALRAVLDERRPALVAQLDEELQQMFVREHGGLSAGLAKGKDFREQLVALLRTRSRIVVLGTVRAAALAQKTFKKNSAGAGGDELLRSCLAEAMPELIACGGDRRLLVMTGDEQDAAALAHAATKITGHAPSMVVDGSSDPVLCYEVAALRLWDAAALLIDGQPHCAALAARLHTRCDVEWSPLPLPE